MTGSWRSALATVRITPMTDMIPRNAARPLSIPQEPAVADLPQSPSAAYAQGWREGWIAAWSAARAEAGD